MFAASSPEKRSKWQKNNKRLLMIRHSHIMDTSMTTSVLSRRRDIAEPGKQQPAVSLHLRSARVQTGSVALRFSGESRSGFDIGGAERIRPRRQELRAEHLARHLYAA